MIKPIESRGKTVHLLKQQSKPIQSRKERKKYDLYEQPEPPKFIMPNVIGTQPDVNMEDKSEWKDGN